MTSRTLVPLVLLVAAGGLSAVGGGIWFVTRDPPPRVEADSPGAAGNSDDDADRPRTRRRVEVVAAPVAARWAPAGWDRAVALHAEGRSADALALLVDLRRVHIDFFEQGDVARLVAEMEAAAAAAAAEARRLEQGRAGDRESVEGAPADERAVVERHLGRFGLAGAGSAATEEVDGGAGQEGWADEAIRRAVAQRVVPVVPDAPLPVAGPLEEVERRRVEQLRKVRERGVVVVLDPIHAGLSWLALHQAADGSFGDDATAARCAELAHGSCLAESQPKKYDLAATSLAVLAFLDFRDQDARGVFEPNLTAGVRWLQARVAKDGSLTRAGYERGIALLALGQAAAASDEPELRDAVRRAWAHTAANIGADGGYRYSARPSSGDLSVTGWYVQAYEVARDAGIELPEDLPQHLLRFTVSMWRGASAFAYVVGTAEREDLASVGMLSLAILGRGDDPVTRHDWLEFLEDVPERRTLNLYRLYYDVRMDIFLRGAPVEARRDELLEFAAEWQTQEGAPLGRFWTTSADNKVEGKKETKREAQRKVERPQEPKRVERWIARGGPTVFTAFAVLTLEHALYRR